MCLRELTNSYHLILQPMSIECFKRPGLITLKDKQHNLRHHMIKYAKLKENQFFTPSTPKKG